MEVKRTSPSTLYQNLCPAVSNIHCPLPKHLGGEICKIQLFKRCVCVLSKIQHRWKRQLPLLMSKEAADILWLTWEHGFDFWEKKMMVTMYLSQDEQVNVSPNMQPGVLMVTVGGLGLGGRRGNWVPFAQAKPHLSSIDISGQSKRVRIQPHAENGSM